MTVLVIAETEGNLLLETTARLVAAARRIDSGVHVLVIDDEAQSLSDAARRLAGVDRVLSVPCRTPDLLPADTIAALLPRPEAGYAVYLGADGGRGRQVVPLLAASLGLAPLTGVSAIAEDHHFERPVHAGALIERLGYDAPVRLLTVRTAAFSPVGPAAPCPIETLAPAALDSRITLTRAAAEPRNRPELESARIVVAGGRGLGSRDNFDRLGELADRLDAALGASRVAVDMGWAENSAQIGQTGRQIAPELYIAIGISGAPQHLAGIREARRVVAINRDAEAPIFRHADYGLVADVAQVLPQLLQLLAAKT